MGKRISDIGKLLLEHLSDYVLLVPLLVAVTAYLFGLAVAPDIDTDAQQARWTSFFGTTAQVTATLLVVLAVEGRLAARTKMMPRLGGAVATMLYIAVGLLAAGAALSPSLSDDVYCQLFALTLAASVGALLSVVLIGIRTLSVGYAERDEAFRDQVQELYAALEAVKRPPQA